MYYKWVNTTTVCTC